MTREEAEAVLRDCGEWIGWAGRTPTAEEAKDSVVLDGHFAVEQLEAIVVLMRAAGQEPAE